MGDATEHSLWSCSPSAIRSIPAAAILAGRISSNRGRRENDVRKYISGFTLCLAALPGTSHAAVVVSVAQIGSNVVATTSGSLDPTGLEGVGLSPTQLGVIPKTYIATGGDPDGTQVYVYYGMQGTSSFGNSRDFVAATSGTGVSFGIEGDGRYAYVAVPKNYISGSSLAGTSLFANTTVAALGLQGGTYVFRSARDSVTINIDVTAPIPAVPEPATWAMMLIGFGMLAGAARYHRRSVKVSLA